MMFVHRKSFNQNKHSTVLQDLKNKPIQIRNTNYMAVVRRTLINMKKKNILWTISHVIPHGGSFSLDAPKFPQKRGRNYDRVYIFKIACFSIHCYENHTAGRTATDNEMCVCVCVGGGGVSRKSRQIRQT